MICTIDQQAVPTDTVTYQQLNFNQRAEGLPLLDYRLSLPPDEFVERCEDIYAKFVQWEKENDPYYRAGEDILIDRWRQLGYLHLPELIQCAPDVVAGLVRERMKLVMLERLVPLVKGHVRYVINTLDRVEVRTDEVAMFGKVWQRT